MGVVLDFGMKWPLHVEYLKNKIRKYILAFRQLNEIMNKNSIICIRPVIA